MKLVGRIPVEPLDDERWTNIERRVVAGAIDAAPGHPAGARRRYLGFAAAAMAAMAAGVVGWKLGARTAETPSVTEAAPVRVATDAQRSSIDLGDATIQSAPSTGFVVTRLSGGVLVEMSRGKVELEVAKRANRPPLVVRAGDTDVIVVGTHFTVDYGDGTGDVDVRVTEGVVKVVRHSRQLRVAAGSSWNTQRGVIPLAAAGPARTGAPVGSNAADTQPSTGAVASNDDPTRTGSGGYAIEMGDAPEILHDRTSQVPDARSSTSRNPNAGSNAKPGTAGIPPAHNAADPMLDLKTLVAQQVVEPALDIGEPQPEKAVPRYRDIVNTKKGNEASRAFYSIAVVQALKLGRTGDALQTLDQYLRRFAGGKEYTAALWLRVRILCGRAIDEKCRQAAYTYVHSAPDSPAAHVAERITISE